MPSEVIEVVSATTLAETKTNSNADNRKLLTPYSGVLQMAEFARRHHDNDRSKVYISASISREAVLEAPQTLIIDLLVFLKAGPRPYHEVMDAWRTSCPRLPIWEDAVDLGLVEREQGFVVLTEAGKNLLALQS